MNARGADRLAAFFAILLLAALAVGSYYLAEISSRSPNAGPLGKPTHDPDAFVDHLVLTRINPQGEPVYRVEASRAIHYPDDDSTELFNPRAISLNPSRPAMTVTANRAVTDSSIKKAVLDGDVHIIRASEDPGLPDLYMDTEHAEVFIDDEIVRSDRLVRFHRGDTFLTGVGMEFNNPARTLVLQSKVTGTWADKAIAVKSNPAAKGS